MLWKATGLCVAKLKSSLHILRKHASHPAGLDPHHRVLSSGTALGRSRPFKCTPHPPAHTHTHTPWHRFLFAYADMDAEHFTQTIWPAPIHSPTPSWPSGFFEKSHSLSTLSATWLHEITRSSTASRGSRRTVPRTQQVDGTEESVGSNHYLN